MTRSERAVTVRERAERRVIGIEGFHRRWRKEYESREREKRERDIEHASAIINEHMPAEYLASQRDFRPLAHAIADACEKARSE